MSTPKDGGPAFPVCTDFSRVNEGMSLRDWFAGQALSRLAYEMGADAAAVDAYEYADAMLAERAKEISQ